jgi:hypothetical protein
MATAVSCTIDALHQRGRHYDMVRFGDERHPIGGPRCGDCGAARGGWHHVGCDLQECPVCGGQLITCGCRFDEDDVEVAGPEREPLGVDGNGLITERAWIGDQEVIIHHDDDLPESDITTVHGIRCTTPLRTAIDLAPELSTEIFAEVVQDFLERGLFTVDEAWRRLGEPDMATRRGADLLRQLLRASEEGATPRREQE